MDKLKRMFKVRLIVAVFMTVGSVFVCGLSQAEKLKEFKKFTIYQDKPSANHYVISGFMPSGKCAEMDDAWQENCQEGRSCIKAAYGRECSTMNQGWAGVYWLQPANNWGDQNGGFDLTGAAKLVFWVRGEKGGEAVVFKMGGVGMAHQYPDSDAASSEPITLTKEWNEYSIDLKGKNLARITGGFAWIASAKDNQSNAVFYLDNIYYQ